LAFGQERDMNTKNGLCALVALVSVVLPWALAMAGNKKPDEAASAIAVYKFTHTDPEVAAKVLQEVYRDRKDVKIIVDKRNNAVIVSAPQESQKMVGEILRQLDEPENGRGRTKSLNSEDEIARMTDAELRKFVFILSRQVRGLRERVAQLEEKTSYRIMPIQTPTK
jgi:hypothetical protein